MIGEARLRPEATRQITRQLDGPDRALAEWSALAAVPGGLLIAGEWRPARDGDQIEVEDPATAQPLRLIADASEAECVEALASASAAFPVWSAASPRQRARVLRDAAERLLEDIDRLALVLSLETGKPLTEAREEVSFSAEYLEWNAEEAYRISGRIAAHPGGSGAFMVTRRPVGPCLVISPWNFPMAIPARGVAPALAAGCTVVLRASDLAPLSALALADALQGAGLPPGCLNVVVSSAPEATDVLLDDRRLKKLTFTGSSRVGAHLLARSASRALRVTAELGGNAPFIVFADSDMDEVVEATLAAKFRNGGQACTAANRVLVERPIADTFAIRLAERVAGLSIGRGAEGGADIGPMISEAAADRLTALVDDAVGRGARLVLPGGRGSGPGHFFAPVILADVPCEARVMQEEIFGPIMPIRAFDTEQQAIELANASELGLAAYVQSANLARAMRVAQALEAGMVGVNCGRVSCAAAPFGGVKSSGFGRSGGQEGIDEYLETSYLAMPAVVPPTR